MAKAGVQASKLGPAAAIVILNAPWVLMTILMAVLVRTKVIDLVQLGWILPLTTVLALIPSIVYWRKLDEPSREAHKFAFFWGTGCALLVVILIGFELMFVPGFRQVAQDWIDNFIAATRGVFGREPAAVGLWVGILGGSLVLILGYTAAWMGWWASQRIGTKAD